MKPMSPRGKFKFGDKVHDAFYGGNYIFWCVSPGDKGDCWLVHKTNPMTRGFMADLRPGWNHPAKVPKRKGGKR